MTNAEKFRKIFKEFATEVWAFSEKDFLTWLNADYEESTIRNCFGCKYSKDNHNSGTEECHLCMWENQYTPTTKNDLGVDCISREATVKRLCNLAEFMNKHKENSGDPYIMAALFIQDNKTEFPSVTPQEPILDKIRAEIETKYGQCDICEYFEDYDYEENDISEYRPIGDIADILQIIDKYKAESEE